MGLIFGAPWGALALLAIPALIAVHMLRQRPPRLEIATLFLLAPTATRTPRGRRVSRLSRRAQLLARIIAALAITWLLVAPRWPREDAAIEAVVVLDASASMAAFSDRVRPALRSALGALAANHALSLTVRSSAPRRAALGRGGVEALEPALSAWRPNLGLHDPGPALLEARQAAGRDGAVIFVTDHPGDDPPGVSRLSVGAPRDNVAFTGVQVRETPEGWRWEATVRSYAATPARRAWRVQARGEVGLSGEVELEPGQTRRLVGAFPDGADRLELVLDPDALEVDDRLPLVRPRRRQLRLFVDGAATELELVKKLLAATPRVQRVAAAAQADLRVEASEVAPGGPPDRLWFFRDPQLELRRPAVGVVAEADPLTDGLPWAGLVFRTPPRGPRPEARGLLWKGERAVVTAPGGGGLSVHFDPRGSNAHTSPAMVVMLSRYLDGVRSRIPRREVLGVEVGQPLEVPARTGAGALILTTGAGSTEVPPGRWAELRAPLEPGFFDVKQGERVLFEGAARFADVRESDLSKAAAVDLSQEGLRAVVRRYTRPDPWRRAWILLALVAMLASFALGREDVG